MQEELSMIEKNNTWELINRPTHKKAIGVKWVYRTKLNSNGSVNKHKVRLVVKGYAQMFGMNFSETFALVARLDTIRMLLALPTQKGWKIYRLDVKSAFLNGYLEEEIFVEQPEEFAVKGKEDKVYQLKKALYGLKQAPRAWYNRINAHLLGSNQYLMDKFKDEMEEVFEMTDLGDMSYFLGMEVHHNQHEIFICQQQYAKEILKKFKMEECKPTTTPMNQKEKFCKENGAEKVNKELYRSMIGCLMYLTTTRLDIVHVVQNFHFHGFSDSDWVGSVDDMRSTSALWIRKLLTDLNMEQTGSTQVFVDNQAAISIASNPVFHGRTKHFKIKFYFLREIQHDGEVTLVHCKLEVQNVDILTKALPRARNFLEKDLEFVAPKSRRRSVEQNALVATNMLEDV
ncbi:Copia protein [Vitis vinifera]|uniref:Copia protein n=1 Tax=Vitis vinifera TaxID=29760 RepID=A0A438FMC0_VITVI|nr:Copia protein [Vitis vinifera]